MLCLLRLLPVLVIRFFCSRRDLLLENFALRQQLAVLKPETFPSSPCRHRQAFLDDIAAVLVPVEGGIDSLQPETVVRWHRAGFSCIGWVGNYRRDLLDYVIVVNESRDSASPPHLPFVVRAGRLLESTVHPARCAGTWHGQRLRPGARRRYRHWT